MNRRQTVHAGPPHIAAQVAAAWASLDASGRDGDLANALSSQERAFLGAMREMQVVRDFVGSPEKILGSTATKHGEIAEQVNVAINRARDVLFGNAPTATLEGVGRLAPVDYRVDGMDIQSKYYNGLYNTLGGVSDHSAKYPGFASDSIYHIPRDQYEQFHQLNRTGTHRWTLRQERKRNQRQTRLAGTADRQVGGRSDQSGRDHVPRGAAGTYSRHDQRP